MDEKEELVLKLREEKLTIHQIAKEVKIWGNTVSKILKKHNLNKAIKSQEIIEKENLAIKYFQEGMTTREIAKKLKMGRATISRVLKENQLSGRKIKYKFDETIFDNIDNEIKAYFLGFLYADGNVSSRDNATVIEIKGSDSYILEQFSQFIFKDNLVKQYKRDRYNDGYIGKLSIYSKRIKDRLIEFGCHPNKTFTLKFPETLDSVLYHHFIRGYFDGDGCIYVFPDGKDAKFTIIGTFEFLTSISNIFNKIQIDNHLTYISETNNNTYALHVKRRESIDKLYDYLYDNATVFLTRKHDKYLNWKTVYKTPKVKIKKTISSELLNKVQDLYDQNLGARKIAKELNITRWAVQQIYKELGVYNIGRKKPKSKTISIHKVCKKCKKDLPIEKFRSRSHKNGSIYYESYCLNCEKLELNQHREKKKKKSENSTLRFR